MYHISPQRGNIPNVKCHCF